MFSFSCSFGKILAFICCVCAEQMSWSTGEWCDRFSSSERSIMLLDFISPIFSAISFAVWLLTLLFLPVFFCTLIRLDVGMRRWKENTKPPYISISVALSQQKIRWLYFDCSVVGGEGQGWVGYFTFCFHVCRSKWIFFSSGQFRTFLDISGRFWTFVVSNKLRNAITILVAKP